MQSAALHSENAHGCTADATAIIFTFFSNTQQLLINQVLHVPYYAVGLVPRTEDRICYGAYGRNVQFMGLGPQAVDFLNEDCST